MLKTFGTGGVERPRNANYNNIPDGHPAASCPKCSHMAMLPPPQKSHRNHRETARTVL